MADVVDSARSVDVDGVSIDFDGVAMGDWAGTAGVDDVSVSLVTAGLGDTGVSIGQIDDPSSYLLKSARR